MKDFWCQRKGVITRQIKKPFTTSKFGFSLLEVVVTVAIIAILAGSLWFFVQRHLMRSRDATRKSDLGRLRTAFEEYYNDHRCYPLPYMLMACGTQGGDGFGDPDDIKNYYPHLYPAYLKTIPCDPLNNKPYLYFSKGENICNGYRLLAALEITDDPDITSIGCDLDEGCGWTDPTYNYGVAVGDDIVSTVWTGGTVVDDGSGDEPTPVGNHYCRWNDPTSRYGCTALDENTMLIYSCSVTFEFGWDCVEACNSVSPDPGVACTLR